MKELIQKTRGRKRRKIYLEKQAIKLIKKQSIIAKNQRK
jgi:hypothetical protein